MYTHCACMYMHVSLMSSVSYRGWGTWDFLPLSSSFPPQALLTSAILLCITFPPQEHHVPLPCLPKKHDSVWNTDEYKYSDSYTQWTRHCVMIIKFYTLAHSIVWWAPEQGVVAATYNIVATTPCSGTRSPYMYMYMYYALYFHLQRQSRILIVQIGTRLLEFSTKASLIARSNHFSFLICWFVMVQGRVHNRTHPFLFISIVYRSKITFDGCRMWKYSAHVGDYPLAEERHHFTLYPAFYL